MFDDLIFQDLSGNNVILTNSLDDGKTTDYRLTEFEQEEIDYIASWTDILFYIYFGIGFLVLVIVILKKKMSTPMFITLALIISLYPFFIDTVALYFFKMFRWIIANVMGTVYV